MRMKKIFMLLMAVIMVCNSGLTTMAATWDNVDSFEKVYEIFEQDTDETVIINLSGDIVAEDSLGTKIGQKYIINGKEYTITNAYFYGDGEVEINASIKSDEYSAFGTGDNVVLELNGDIDTYYGIDAFGDSKITVNGNVTTENASVMNHGNAEIIINGNVTSTNDYAVATYEQSKTNINGNIEGKYGAIEASAESEVTVVGNVKSSDLVPDEDGNLEYGNMDDPDGYSDSSSAVEVFGNAKVTITGDVKAGDSYGTYAYAGFGINASETASVLVNGNVYGGKQIANPDAVPDEYSTGIAGAGIGMDATANVTVNGNVIGGDTNAHSATAGHGAVIYIVPAAEDREAGKLYVSGTLEGNVSIAENGVNGSAIDVTSMIGTLTLQEITNEGIPEDVFEDIFYNDYSVYQVAMIQDRTEEWYRENYVYALNTIFEEKVGKLFWDTYDMAEEDGIQALLDAIEDAGLSEEEIDELMNDLVEEYNSFIAELNAFEYEFILPEVTVGELKAPEGTDLVVGEEGYEEFAETLEENINYLTPEEENPETGDNFFVWTTMSVIAMYGIVMTLRKKLVK